MDDQRNIGRHSSLLSQFKQGDLKAFKELYDLYGKRVEIFAMTYLKSKEDAEEIVQDVFLKLWQTRDRLNLELAIDGYIFRIVKNLSLNKLRKRVGEPNIYTSIYEDIIQVNQTENDLDLLETKKILNIAIQALPPRRQLIFRMSRLEGLNNKEIAKKLHLSVNTVEGQIRKASKFLRTYIGLIKVIIATITLV